MVLLCGAIFVDLVEEDIDMEYKRVINVKNVVLYPRFLLNFR
jgi:hypothetical protein